MVVDTAGLFGPQNRNIGCCRCFGITFQIFGSHTLTFLSLTLLQWLSWMVLASLLLGILALIFAAMGLSLTTVLMDNGPGRQLRELYDSYSSPNDDAFPSFDSYDSASTGTTDDFVSLEVFWRVGTIFMEYLAVMIIFVVVAVILSIMVVSAFRGAKIRAVAHVYAGESPSLIECLDFGWKKKHLVACFNILVTMAFGVTYLVLGLGLPALVAEIGDEDAGNQAYTVMYIILHTAFAVAGAALFAGPSMIMVESKGVISAFYGTLGLTKNHLCFIFCTRLLFLLMYIAMFHLALLIAIIVGIGNGKLGAFVAIVLAIGLGLSFDPLMSILEGVLYLTLRIRDEGLTRASLAQQLQQEGTSGATYNVVPTIQEGHPLAEATVLPKESHPAFGKEIA